MRPLVLVAALTVVGVPQVQLGAVKVMLPAPAGFEDMFATSDDIKRRFPSTLTQDTLAVHVPSDVAATFRPGQALSYYTLVRVLKEVRAVDVTAAEFKELAAALSKKKLFSMKEAQDYIAAAERRTGMALGTPTELGVVGRTPQSVSVMSLIPLSKGPQQVTRVTVMAAVYIRRRLIYLNSFRDLATVDDIKILQDFSGRWVEAVIAANK